MVTRSGKGRKGVSEEALKEEDFGDGDKPRVERKEMDYKRRL